MVLGVAVSCVAVGLAMPLVSFSVSPLVVTVAVLVVPLAELLDQLSSDFVASAGEPQVAAAAAVGVVVGGWVG